MKTIQNGRTQEREIPRFYDVAVVAGIFGMSKITIYRAISGGKFPAVRVGARLAVPAKAIDEMEQAAVRDWTLVDAEDWVRPEAVANAHV